MTRPDRKINDHYTITRSVGVGGWVQRFFLSARRLSPWESRAQLPCLFVPDTAAGRLAGHVGTLPPGTARKGPPALNHINGTPLITLRARDQHQWMGTGRLFY